MTEGDNSVALIMGILFGVVGFFIVVIFVYVVWMRKKGKLDKNLEESGQPYVPYPMLSYYSRRQSKTSAFNLSEKVFVLFIKFHLQHLLKPTIMKHLYLMEWTVN